MELPKEIKRLDEVVVNRIAAGEIIQRPANALKELIENSLDANSTSITITLKSGGLKYMQINDNGTGIRKEDLPILCERFTTSKLQNYEELSNISTFGFRGEALASISHVAHLTIQTKTANELCAYRVAYVDGKMKENPKACAGNQGTQITVEDLFFNIPTRKKALKNPNDEYAKVYDIVSRYAIHNPSISFILRKFGEKNDLRTSINSTYANNIRTIYGSHIAKELLEIRLSNREMKFELHGYITNANYSLKKEIFLLFINSRLVDSLNLRKAIDLVYSTYLPKGMHPFVYLSLNIDSKNCDVNIHPTKHEVHFLYETEIIDSIKSAIENELLGCNISRTFYTQTKLPGVKNEIHNTENKCEKLVYDKNLVRTNSDEQKIDKFFGGLNNTVSETTNRSTDITLKPSYSDKNNKVEVKLISVLQLRKRIETECNITLREIFSQHKFVGIISLKHSLIQYDTMLYLCNNEILCEELFYQFIIYDFQNFNQITFIKPIPIYDLTLLAFDMPEIDYNESRDGARTDLSKNVKNILIEKSEMLNVYFAIDIDSEGNLKSIPMLLKNYIPDMTYLPIYILKLATEVNWEIEIECFETFARQTAIFYSKISTCDTFQMTCVSNNWEWLIEHVVYPSIKKYLMPSNDMLSKNSVLQIANLPDLYKVFERC